MTPRSLLFLSLLPLSALAQIQVFQFDGTTETAVGALVNVGTATPGDTLETRFRVRNIGSGAATFQTLSIAGDGFQISAKPTLPYTLAPYSGPASEAEFRVTFTPSITGSYSASLLVNTINVALRGVSTPAATLLLAGSKTPLSAGSVIDFGSVVQGGSKLQGFALLNAGNTSLNIATLSVSGTGFRGPIGLTQPVSLAPGQTVSFQVAFEPQTGPPAQGRLNVDRRSFNLTGLGLDPPLPGASITLASTLGASGQQNSLSIPLASVSQVNGNGTLTMAFKSSVTGVADDAAIQFLSGPKRAATVTISAGDSAAKFGTQSSIAFQTGATAGTITFTLTLPGGTQQSSLTIAPSPISVDTATSIRKLGELDVSLTGMDNTYTASQLSFTFYDSKGAAVQPGAIRVDATSSFQQYFAASPVGGLFALLAKFPVTGDTSQVAAVDVQVTSSAGVTTAQKIPIGN
jgi:hypothetical protein